MIPHEFPERSFPLRFAEFFLFKMLDISFHFVYDLFRFTF